MYSYIILFISVMTAGAIIAEPQELIMLEIQPIIYEKSIVKRSPLPQYAAEQQYVQQSAPNGAPASVPQEYYQFLSSLQLQQPGAVQQQQVDPNNLQQVLVSRTPQTFTGQPPRPPPRRLTPEQEQQRRLQENIAQKSIREQEVRDAQRAQQAQYQRLYQQQGVQIDPLYLAQLQQAQQQYVQLPEARQFVQVPPQAQQYIQVPTQQQQQYVPAPQAQQEPERVSYSQVQFGSSKLPRRLSTKLLPQPVQSGYVSQPQQQQQPQQQVIYTQAPQQQAYIQPKAQQLVYPPQAQDLAYIQQNDVYQQQPRRPAAEAKESLPQQYLIETTKVEPVQPQQVVNIPKPKGQIYYRPQPNYQELQASILAQQQQLQYAQQQLEASTTSATPSRSTIYVSSSRTPALAGKGAASIPEVRLPKQDGQRPLSQNELNALINAGFKVTPSAGQEFVSYQPQFTYYRELGKRQNRPVPRPVHLTSEERRALAKEGIRNLYRVETAESSDSPVTYVLALSTPGKQQQ